ncbi:hypothetical protein ABKA04_005375 [Annulohypoxylon sp. FPYF3050]
MDYGLHDQHASYILSQSNRGEEDTNLDASWVMLSRAGEIEPLPHETILHRTRGRIALSITAPNQPAGIPPLNIKSESGPWYWEALVRPVPDGNIPPEFPRVNLRLTFKDGGSSEFESKFVELKGRLHHAAQIAEESGQSNWAQTVHDEQLPEYSGPQGGDSASQVSEVARQADEAVREQQAHQQTPDEPPPNYDEAQAQAVSMRFDERMREEAERE